ncbi:hypothetical protein [Paenibacillus hamazuiensis]|uniref:hypothetical protein n=1 Tax=Paenibacillus hamazuiensis TaxID=2936508 RepID=UPI00200D99C9|nr:hypothetical protein [Paenibacillus hamazuiensis]
MVYSKRAMTSLLAGTMAFIMLVPGCGQPSPPVLEGAVDLSVKAANSASGKEVTPSASASQGNRNEQASKPELQNQPAETKPADTGKTGDAGATAPAGTPDVARPSASPAASREVAAETKAASPNPQPEAPQGTAAANSETVAKPDPANAPVQSAPIAAAQKAEPKAEAAPDDPSGSAVKTAEEAASKEKPAVNIATDAKKVPKITFQDLYSEITVRGVKISDKINNLNGKKVEMVGFMAPPLTAKVHFFVLTKVALTICPFCSTDADWPTDIVVVFMPNGKDVTPTEHQVKVTGTLSVGSQTDEETGFVSLIRINADKVEVLK